MNYVFYGLKHYCLKCTKALVDVAHECIVVYAELAVEDYETGES